MISPPHGDRSPSAWHIGPCRFAHPGLLALSLVAAPVCGPACAQTGIQGIPQDRPDQKKATAPVTATKPATRNAVPRDPVAAITPFTLTSVTLDGSTASQPELSAAYRPFIGTIIGNAELTKITNAIAAVYERSDIALYTVLVPNQTFAGGRLRLLVIEGYVGAVEVRGNLRRQRAGLLRAYLRRLEHERPLRRSSLQRVVSLIRDIPGLVPDVNLDRGEAQGSVKLVIKARERVVQAATGVSDRGTAQLGRVQATTDVYVSGLLGGGDQLHGSLVVPTHVNRFQYYSLSYLTPVDADGTTASITGSHLRTRPAGVPLNGDATSLALQVSHPIIRSYGTNLYATLGLDGIDTSNALFGSTLSNDRVRAARASLSFSRSGTRNQLTLSATGSVGLDVLGARVAAGQADQRFRKLNLRLLDTLQIGKSVSLRLNGVVQVTPDNLPSSEQLALGGDEFGRAYEAAIIAGDKGYAGSVEFAWVPQGLPTLVKGSEAFVYADDGRTVFKGRLGADAFASRVASVGGGVRAAVAARTVVQLELTRGLYNPVFYEDRKKFRALFSIRTLLK